MTTQHHRRSYSGPGTLAVVLAMLAFGVLFVLLRPAAPAGAQDTGPDAQLGQVPAAQGFNPGQGGPQGPPMGPGGFPGGFQGPPPFAMGTVAEVDKNANTIYVEAFFGQEQEVKVTQSTKFVTQTTAKVSELKVGDRVQVQGVPTGIVASSMTIGEPPEALSFRPPMPQRQGSSQRSSAPQNMAFATATGTVKALNPLTIAAGSSVTVTVRVASDARINKYAPTTLANIKEGDRIMAAGTRNADGSLTATTVAINLGGPGGGPFGPGMPGMPGMGPGGPRPGGQGPQGQPPTGR